VLVVGPACVLTHGTAALSFIALMFSESDLIRTFGQAGLIATVIALLAVLMLVPILGILLVRDGDTVGPRRARTRASVPCAPSVPGSPRGWFTIPGSTASSASP
jgi:predicted RND superfamily exporter protein